jgi:hypothetical protein
MQVSELTLRLPFGALGENRREARGEERGGGGGDRGGDGYFLDHLDVRILIDDNNVHNLLRLGSIAKSAR